MLHIDHAEPDVHYECILTAEHVQKGRCWDRNSARFPSFRVHGNTRRDVLGLKINVHARACACEILWNARCAGTEEAKEEDCIT